MTELETPRLRLRQWRDDDVAGLLPMDSDPEVMRYIGPGTVRTPDEVAAWLGRARKHWDEHGYGLFAAEVRETGVLAGWVGLATPNFLPEVLPAVEIGWRLRRDHWGQGLATEGARVALRFALHDRELDRVVSIRHPDNRSSGRVMEKLGMTLDRRTTVPGWNRAADVYAITRAEYDSAAA